MLFDNIIASYVEHSMTRKFVRQKRLVLNSQALKCGNSLGIKGASNKFRVGERIEQTHCGISFRNFGSIQRGWTKIPDNRSNWKIPFHSTIRGLFGPSFSKLGETRSAHVPFE